MHHNALGFPIAICFERRLELGGKVECLSKRNIKTLYLCEHLYPFQAETLIVYNGFCLTALINQERWWKVNVLGATSNLWPREMQISDVSFSEFTVYFHLCVSLAACACKYGLCRTSWSSISEQSNSRSALASARFDHAGCGVLNDRQWARSIWGDEAARVRNLICRRKLKIMRKLLQTRAQGKDHADKADDPKSWCFCFHQSARVSILRYSTRCVLIFSLFRLAPLKTFARRTIAKWGTAEVPTSIASVCVLWKGLSKVLQATSLKRFQNKERRRLKRSSSNKDDVRRARRNMKRQFLSRIRHLIAVLHSPIFPQSTILIHLSWKHLWRFQSCCIEGWKNFQKKNSRIHLLFRGGYFPL